MPQLDSTPPKPAKTAFISGPLEVNHDYFTHYYLPHLTPAIDQSHHFILGPVSGIDSLAFDYLTSHPSLPNSNVTIYLAAFEAASRPQFVKSIRDQGVNVHVEEDCLTTWDRDAAMTRDSDYDILRYRTEKEQKMAFGEGRWRARVSNTERNERRRGRYQEEGDFRGEEEVKVGYVRHWDVKEGKCEEDGGAEICDGMCDGHRDVILVEAEKGRVFGFGGDGLRRF